MNKESKSQFQDRTAEFEGEELPAQTQDEERVIVNMNVEGMPGYRPERPEAQMPSSGEMMSKKETRQFMLTATLTGLLVAAIFSAVLILFTLFCTQVWFA